MAPSKLAILSIFLALIFSQIRADMKVPDEENEQPSFPNEQGSPDSWSSKLKAPLRYAEKTRRRLFGGNAKEQNKNEQSENGASPEEREKVIQELREEGDKVIQELREEWGKVIQEMLDSIIQEMLGSISSLPTEIKFLQIGKTNDEQETKIRKTEHALEVKMAEVEMWKAKFEATLKAKVLNEVKELEKELQSQRNEKEDLKDWVNEAEKKIDDLLSKIDNVNELEKELQLQRNEKADLKDKVNELEKELQLQRNEKGDLKNQLNEAEKKMDDLLSKIENVNELEKELQLQRNEKGDLKDRVNEAEKKMDDLLSKMENLNKLEKELQLQRNEKGDLKDRVNEAEKKMDDLLSIIENINQLEKELQLQRNEKGDLKNWVNEAEKKIDDLLSKIENKWIPAIKEQWVVVKDTVELHLKSLSTKTIEVYEVSKTTLAPHVIKAQVVDPYFQEAKKFSKPYVDQLTTVTKPHVDKAVIAYEKFLKSASTYHHQVQGAVKDLLKRHEPTRPLATKELEWFVASALVALLIIILFRTFSSLFWLLLIRARACTPHCLNEK